jgi:hypothetical protein
MSEERSPAFQYYPRDLLTDENWAVMSWFEKGVYWELVSICWLEGSISADVSRLARMLKMTTNRFGKCWPQISPCFRPGRSGRLIHPRLEHERLKQCEHRQKSARGGRASADQRARQGLQDTAAEHKLEKSEENLRKSERKLKKNSVSMKEDTNSEFSEYPKSLAKATNEGKGGSTTLQPPLELGTNQSPALLLLSSSSTAVRTPCTPPRNNFSIDERGGRFCERYAELYQKHRHGAFYQPSPTLDFQAAVAVCATWEDDAHLERLVIAWLTHEDARDRFLGGTRSIMKFKSRASGYDEQIRADDAMCADGGDPF